MHKSENTILIWVLTWAGILLALLYSPLGSPDLYRHRIYFTEDQGVNFSKSGISKASTSISFIKAIKNAPGNASGNQNDDSELNIPTENKTQRNRYNYTAAGSTKRVIQNIAAVTIHNNHFKSNMRAGELNGSKNSSINGGGGTSVAGLSNTFGSHKSSQNNSGLQNGGINAANLDLSVFGDSTANQINRNLQKVESFSDPGNIPLDQPIPIPDGGSFLILSGLIYCGYILLKKRIINSRTIEKM
ncbi:MAG: hypothetical protein Q8904_09450 [Bacteroidota bacterium]|nr:hypothetical protein [Bacteroidota bacterium]